MKGFGHSSVSQNAQKRFMRFCAETEGASPSDMCPQAGVRVVGHRENVKLSVCCEISTFSTLAF